jgi:hypothetical protein
MFPLISERERVHGKCERSARGERADTNSFGSVLTCQNRSYDQLSSLPELASAAVL